jgi:hypothetical protein
MKQKAPRISRGLSSYVNAETRRFAPLARVRSGAKPTTATRLREVQLSGRPKEDPTLERACDRNLILIKPT